ncbi:hypothetical protein SEPCBS119000_001913 [Sporothrix epigloea]|uniref:Uncharacterized protein n=1 Tax=Sporothrix epigloea TaxID=1892477 RepID=A0ABP0DDK2_9PEZI
MEVARLPDYIDHPDIYGDPFLPKQRSNRSLTYDNDDNYGNYRNHGIYDDYDNYDDLGMYDADDRPHYHSHDTSRFRSLGRRPDSGAQYTEMPDSYDLRYHNPDKSLTQSRYYGASGNIPDLRRGASSTSAGSYDQPPTSSYAQQGGYRGMGSAGVLGIAAAGAVAGAALTYSVMRRNSQSRSRYPREHEYDDAGFTPSFERRSTYPEPQQNYGSSRYGGESIRGLPQKEIREIEYLPDFDGRSRFSPSRQKSGGSVSGSRTRTRSEAAYDRAPLMIAEGSYHSTRNGSSGPPPSVRPSSRHGAMNKYYAEPAERIDRESYVSGAHSHRMARGSGAGGSRLPPVPPNASRSAPFRQSAGRPGSYMSAHNVPLPASGVGSSHARWEEDDRYNEYNDDNDSVAPSDSISCVGSRGRGSRHYR